MINYNAAMDELEKIALLIIPVSRPSLAERAIADPPPKALSTIASTALGGTAGLALGTLGMTPRSLVAGGALGALAGLALSPTLHRMAVSSHKKDVKHAKKALAYLRGPGIHKKADIAIGDRDNPLVAGGVFVGTDRDHKRKSQEIVKILQKQRSLQALKKAWLEKYPDDFVTAAYKHEAVPGLFTKFKGLIGMEKAKKTIASYKNRKAHPRIFIRVGRAGSPDQTAFYNAVGRGLYDRELPKAEVPEGPKATYRKVKIK